MLLQKGRDGDLPVDRYTLGIDPVSGPVASYLPRDESSSDSVSHHLERPYILVLFLMIDIHTFGGPQ